MGIDVDLGVGSRRLDMQQRKVVSDYEPLLGFVGRMWRGHDGDIEGYSISSSVHGGGNMRTT